MYIETSSPRRRGDKAILQTGNEYPADGVDKCLKFWYHMYGRTMGRLIVSRPLGTNLFEGTLLMCGVFP